MFYIFNDVKSYNIIFDFIYTYFDKKTKYLKFELKQ